MSDLQLPHHHGEGQNTEFLKAQLAKPETFQTVAGTFKLLDDSSRLRIFWLLCHCEECVINISAMVEMTSPAVSHHLRQLKDRGLIVSRREGKEVYYKAAETEQSVLLHQVIEKIMKISRCRRERVCDAHGCHSRMKRTKNLLGSIPRLYPCFSGLSGGAGFLPAWSGARPSGDQLLPLRACWLEHERRQFDLPWPRRFFPAHQTALRRFGHDIPSGAL